MPELAIDDWKQRITTVHTKKGKTLLTTILHVDGPDEPPPAVILLAGNNWQPGAQGQFVRRPDENGKQVYWVNVLILF